MHNSIMTSNGAGEQVAIASTWPWTWVNIPLRFSKLMSYAMDTYD